LCGGALYFQHRYWSFSLDIKMLISLHDRQSHSPTAPQSHSPTVPLQSDVGESFQIL
jgi:hypothetical protein